MYLFVASRNLRVTSGVVISGVASLRCGAASKAAPRNYRGPPKASGGSGLGLRGRAVALRWQIMTSA